MCFNREIGIIWITFCWAYLPHVQNVALKNVHTLYLQILCECQAYQLSLFKSKQTVVSSSNKQIYIALLEIQFLFTLPFHCLLFRWRQLQFVEQIWLCFLYTFISRSYVEKLGIVLFKISIIISNYQRTNLDNIK